MAKSESCSSLHRVTIPSDLQFNLQGSLSELEEEKLKLKEAKTKLEEANRIVGRANDGQTLNAVAKIQKIQPYLRNRPDFAKYYSPKLVSIGPIHRGDKGSQQNLEGGEHYKLGWAAMYLEDTNQTAQELFQKVRHNLSAMKELYTEDAIAGFRDKDEELAWVFLLDGCAVLELMDKVDFQCPEQVLKIKVDQLLLVVQDLLLLENQLPYQLLKLLSNDDDNKLNGYINNFLQRHKMIGKEPSLSSKPVKISVDPQPQPSHLLHLLLREILGGVDRKGIEKRKKKYEQKFQRATYRNIQELKAAGISIIKGKERKELTEISFDCGMTLNGFGRLHLSKLMVDDFTLPTFLNLIAYEMCPDFSNGYEISSYVAFMDSLIDHAEDVKELRKANVLLNALGSDQDVADLFNAISTDLVLNTQRYWDVRYELEKRYNTIYFTWIAQVIHNYFSTPWAFLAFAAAVVALFLTFVQTWFAMHPPPSRN